MRREPHCATIRGESEVIIGPACWRIVRGVGGAPHCLLCAGPSAREGAEDGPHVRNQRGVRTAVTAGLHLPWGNNSTAIWRKLHLGFFANWRVVWGCCEVGSV